MKGKNNLPAVFGIFFIGIFIIFGFQLESKTSTFQIFWNINEETLLDHEDATDEKKSPIKKRVRQYLLAMDSLFVNDQQLYTQGWHQLPQPKFWYEIMKMHKDSAIINLEIKRRIKDTVASDSYWELPKSRQKDYLDSLKNAYGMKASEEVFITPGREHFYQFDKVAPSIAKAIEIFKREGVNPWYAQTIMLIESPGSLKKSKMGAYGNFQLMKSVAQKYGLRVSREIDERTNLKKSAKVAARLLKQEYIPYAKEILDRHDIKFDHEALWFKLFVLHVYHAGHGNIKQVMRYLNPEKGGQSLIRELWTTNYRNFQNASQNYSQVALASLMHFDQMMLRKFGLPGDFNLLASNHTWDKISVGSEAGY